MKQGTKDQAATAPTRSNHGCCADKACTDATCMELPTGKTCGVCVHERRCCLMFGHTPTDTYCDWFPRRFREVTANVELTGAAAGLSPQRPESEANVVERRVGGAHHIWCNYSSAGPSSECKQCKSLYARYPMEGTTADELAAQHFPDAVKRETPNAELRGRPLADGPA